MRLKKIICRIFGHLDPVCPNSCSTHGFCERCWMFYSGKTDTWYDDWQDTRRDEQ